jgi:cytochrome c biogenesis factor
MAVVLGVLLALAVGLLVVFGIVEPLFTSIFGLQRAGSDPSFFPILLMALAAAFAFYFGGMAAGYRAPGRRRLHGTLVAPAAFALSPTINLLTGKGLFPGLDNALLAVLLLVVFLAISAAAAYVGARRSEALYAHNMRVLNRRRGAR